MTASQRLKSATHEAHNELEHTVMHECLFAPTMSRTDYTKIISGFYLLFNQIEEKLSGFSICKQMGYINRAHTLRQDLNMLGFYKDEINSMACKFKTPTIESSEQAIGAAYVLFGSRNGSPFIRRHLLKNSLFRDSLKNSMNFFSEQEISEIRTDWQLFLERMDEYFEKHTEQAIEVSINSAIETFSAFKRQFIEIKKLGV